MSEYIFLFICNNICEIESLALHTSIEYFLFTAWYKVLKSSFSAMDISVMFALNIHLSCGFQFLLLLSV